MKKKHSLPILLALAAASLQAAPPEKLELAKGDHVAIVGNTLPDRMQHFGWLEAMILKSNADKDLTVRNLSFATDELTVRQRPDGFGSPDQWLEKVKADVILAYWGFNESFKGQEGLAKFKADLDKYLKDTKGKNYSGKGNPRIVLFSPIAAENLKDGNHNDGAATNERLRYYVDAMAEVAKANDVQFVDLYGPSQRLYAAAQAPLTFNSIHMKDEGDRLLAPVQYKALFGADGPAADDPAVKKIRQAVLEKNEMWHSRYRTVDGYNVYGGRSSLSYNGITNFKVMQEEMSVRDVMTANRDKKVWAVAKGADPAAVKVDDSNAPPVTEVPTNKPDAKPFLDPEEAIKHMTVPKGVKVQLFASEKEFPELVNPVQMAWDTKGRLWVSAWLNYPERTPWSKEGDKLLVLEDTNNDGKADKCTTFIGGLNCPTGFQFYKDGVLVMESPDLWFVRDTDGDGRGDTKERVLSGLCASDSHHETNSMCYEPGGAIYCSDGVFHRTQVETPEGPVRNVDGCIYRYEPRTAKFERYMAYGFANPHGRVFDYWGNDYITDATGNENYWGPASSGFLDEPNKHPGVKPWWNRPSRPCPGTNILSSRAWPAEFQGNFLNTNVISLQAIFRAKISEDGAGMKGETLEHLVISDDPNFRPSGVSVAPDGSVYFMDWSNAIIGHMQHHLRDPNRDHLHGRVYRMTHENGKLLTPVKIDGQPIPALLEALKTPEDEVRRRAKIELDKRPTPEVIAATKAWVAALDKSDKEYEHHRLEGLWVHQWHNVVDADLLKAVLASPEPRARAQAVRVLCYWRDRVPGALALLKTAAADDAPRVRIEAVRACSFFRQWEAADAALVALAKPTDYWLDYTMKETMRQLEQWWKPAVSEGKPLGAGNGAAINYVLGSVSTADLGRLPKGPAVYTALMTRPGVPEADRLGALAALSESSHTSATATLLGILQSIAGNGGKTVEDLSRILVRQPAADLKASGAVLEKLAASGPTALRQAARAALITASGSIDAAWMEAVKSPAALTDFLSAVPSISDPVLRATAFQKALPVLGPLPAQIQSQLDGAKAPVARFVRIELPRRGTLTLAEVQVMSDGKNIAPSGTATQKNVGASGEAKRAIDGNTSPSYSDNGATHTEENTDNPWWELDLGSEKPVESLVVWNRGDGDLGRRLEGFTLTLLDGSKRATFQKAGLPAPEGHAEIKAGSDAAGALRRAAISAAVATSAAEPGKVFSALAALIQKADQRQAAASSLMKLPRTAWDKALAAPTIGALVNWAKTVAVADRTSQEFVETIQVASELAGLLPATEAGTVRKTLRDMSVAVSVVKTVREQMRYDTPRLVVEAGKPFEIIFENDDAMPHNLVVVKPGSHMEVSTAALTMNPMAKDGRGRIYIPGGDKVLDGTKMIDPGERDTLKLTAPAGEAEYEFVCTFPGHGAIMWGRLVVTKDIDAYLQAHPVAQPTSPLGATPPEAGK